jgi:excisionase family DNA binding protein
LAKEVLTIAETAEVLGINVNTAYRAVRSGEIPALRFGDRLVVPRVRLDALLKGDGEGE